MMKYSELYKKICEKVPSSLSLSWDNDGDMLCIDESKEIKKILISLDITLDVINYAAKNSFDLIISHHPLIFKPMKGINQGNITGKRVCKLIQSGICAMSFHTRLDATDVNTALANALELGEVTEFFLDGSPMGRIGVLRNKMDTRGFGEYLKEKLGAACVEYPNIDATIQKVAVLGGSGADAISEAMELGADCLVTGECGYNKSLDCAEMGFPVFTAGHFHTENPVCMRIKDLILDIDNTFDCEVYSSYVFKAL